MENQKWEYINKTTGEKVYATSNPDTKIYIDALDAEWYKNLGTPECKDISTELSCSHQCNNCGDETNDPENAQCSCGCNYWVRV